MIDSILADPKFAFSKNIHRNGIYLWFNLSDCLISWEKICWFKNIAFLEINGKKQYWFYFFDRNSVFALHRLCLLIFYDWIYGQWKWKTDFCCFECYLQQIIKHFHVVAKGESRKTCVWLIMTFKHTVNYWLILKVI